MKSFFFLSQEKKRESILADGKNPNPGFLKGLYWSPEWNANKLTANLSNNENALW